MARYVTISTFATPHLGYDGGGIDAAIDREITHWSQQLDKVAPDRPDLIVLPENCDSYAGMSLDQAAVYHEAKADRVRAHLQDRARHGRCYIAYPATRVLADGTRRNSLQLIDRQGHIAGIYDKNYPVIGEIEQCHIRSGHGQVLMHTDFGSLCCAICFDLNFHPLIEATAALRPDLVLFASVYHGGLMQPYWAYRCRAHFVGAVANLPSAIISPDGRTLATTTNYFPYVTCRVNLDCRLAHLDGNWLKLDAMKTKYGDQARFTDPGHLASVLISSESTAFTVDDLIAEFDIEPLDDYLRRSADFVRRPENLSPPP